MRTIFSATVIALSAGTALILSGCNGQLRDDVEQTQVDLTAVEERLALLETEVTNLSGPVDVTALEGRVDDLETDAASLTSAVADNSADITNNIAAIAANGARIAVSALDIADHEARLVDLEDAFGNPFWSVSGDCNCTVTAASFTDVPSGAVTVTLDKPGPILVLGSLVTRGAGNVGTVGARIQVVGSTVTYLASKGALTTKVNSFGQPQEATSFAVFDVPSAGTYRVALQYTAQSTGAVLLEEYALEVVQLTEGM